MTTSRKIAAVAAGFLTVVILSVATDAIMEAAGIFPPLSEHIPFETWMLMIAFSYRSVYAVAGGFVTARIAREQPKPQVIALGILGTMGGLAGVIYGWNMSDHWYPVALMVTAFPLTWAGGRIGAGKGPW